MTTQLLPEIERGETWKRAHRNRCLVRQVLRWKAAQDREALKAIERSPIYLQIAAVIDAQWGKGNQGAAGDWR